MNRPKIVAGNWKMNKTMNEAQALIQDIVRLNQKNTSVTKIIFPPFPFIIPVSESIKESDTFFVGGQNCHTHSHGAYTGEVSAAMIQSIGGTYVLVGHSERRQYFSENSEQLTLKISQALTNGLKPVYCIGETLSERKSGQHFSVVENQLTEVLKTVSEQDMKNVIVAYEPVWAIGTGETATSAQAQEIHAFIRTVLEKIFNPDIAQLTPILYGGSCNAKNAAELFACEDIDGGLIGGASLLAEDFTKIIESF